MADINIGAIAEQLNYKVDLDMHNSEKPYIVETYNDGNGNWYRVWSDKWCEQGGYITTFTPNSYISIIFLKEFANTSYFFTNQIQVARAMGDGWDGGCCDEVLPSRTTIGTEVTTDCTSPSKTHYGIRWEAKGYIL